MHHCPHDEQELSPEVRAELEEFEALLTQAYARIDKAESRPRYETGRNEPCPCGSGRKFKKCCLSTAADDRALKMAGQAKRLLMSGGRSELGVLMGARCT